MGWACFDIGRLWFRNLGESLSGHSTAITIVFSHILPGKMQSRNNQGSSRVQFEGQLYGLFNVGMGADNVLRGQAVICVLRCRRTCGRTIGSCSDREALQTLGLHAMPCCDVRSTASMVPA